MTHQQAILDDLTRIIDQAKWAHGIGYSKAGRGLDAERGTDLSRTENERAAGPTYDLEIGDHRARVAYQRTVIALTRTDRALAAHITGPQPDVLELDHYEPPATLDRIAARIRWRLPHVDNDRTLRHIRTSLDRCVRALSKALDHGPADGIAHAETPCRTCNIRPRADRKTECDTCATWRRRNRGQARPTHLDRDHESGIAYARAAQQRRLARGEGWGYG